LPAKDDRERKLAECNLDALITTEADRQHDGPPAD
jgi:hypothetical protein